MAVFRRSRVIVGIVNVLTKDLFLPVESVRDRTTLKFRGVSDDFIHKRRHYVIQRQQLS